MNASLTRITFHIVCTFRRPSKWRFFAAGIGREIELLYGMLIPAKA